MLAIYTRLSVENEDSASIENQLREGKEFAKNKGLSYQIYNEGEGISGTLDLKDRPELNKLIGDISTDKITSVWMRNQNRMERNSLTFHLFADIIKKNNVKLYFADGKEIDYNDPNTFLSSSILSTLNAYSAQLQSVQTKKSLKDNAKEGKVHGILPYGYTTNENGYIQIDSEESVIIKRIFNMSLSGVGTRSIAEILNKEEIPTRYNKIAKGKITVKNKYTGKLTIRDKSAVKWAGGTIRGIITNTIYKGTRTFSGVEYDAPIIIEPNYWKKVNENLKNNANTSGKKVAHKYLLKGLLECGKCGRNFYGRTRTNKKDNYYMCSSKRYTHENCGNRSINIDVLNNIIWGRFFLDSEYKDLLIQGIEDLETGNRYEEIKIEIQEFDREITTLNNQKSKAIRMTLEGLIKESDIKSTIENIESKIEDTQIKLDNLNEEIQQFEKTEEIVQDMEQDFKNIFLETPYNKKQEILRKYISRITINYVPEKRFYVLFITPNTFNPIPDVLVIDSSYNIMISIKTLKCYPLKKMSRKEYEEKSRKLETLLPEG